MSITSTQEWLLSPNYKSHPNFSEDTINNIQSLYEKQEACFWTAEEIDLVDDLRDWERLNDNERHFITHVLAFFAASDGIVLENLGKHFLIEFKVPEVREFYSFQLAMENVHSETYSLLIDTYLASDPKEKMNLLRAIETIPAVKKKADWALKWINNCNSIAERILAFCAVEGILFSGSFCAIFWLKKRGLMPGFTFSNELISRDEGLHTEFGTLLYNALQHRCPEETAHTIIREALEVEKFFITQSLPVSLIGMNSDLMTEYLQCVSDRLLTALGYSKIWHSSNPFSWMELISLQGKTNFFEKRVGDYQMAGVTSDEKSLHFEQDCDF